MKRVLPKFARASATVLVLTAAPALAQLPDLGKFAKEKLDAAGKGAERLRQDAARKLQGSKSEPQQAADTQKEPTGKPLEAASKPPEATVKQQAATNKQQEELRKREEELRKREEALRQREEALRQRQQEAARGGTVRQASGRSTDVVEDEREASEPASPAQASSPPVRSGARCGYTLTKGDSYPVGKQPSHVLVADFNADGRSDLAVSAPDNKSKVSPVSIFLGRGRGTFDKKPDVVTSAPFVSAAGDFDEDGKVDLVVGAAHQNANVDIFPGKGDGTFLPVIMIRMGAYGTGLAVSDFNGDKHLDFAVSFVSGDNGVAVFPGQGDYTFPKPTIAGPLRASPLHMATGDLNGDGQVDLVTAQPKAPSIGVLFGNADGTFQQPQLKQVVYEPSGVALGDFNGDRQLDVAVADQKGDRVVLLLNTGKGALGKPAYFDVGKSPRALAAADVDGDGRQDLVVANGLHTMSVLSGNGDGTFQPQQSTELQGTPHTLAMGDFNGDRVPDVAVGLLTANALQILLGSCR
ncbi:MAG TPA: FG-GAP-like repeat-containing protein [Archangium sp.]|nr:FG-GAP-like repeat-containing protein [Archangium sp.]